MTKQPENYMKPALNGQFQSPGKFRVFYFVNTTQRHLNYLALQK
jgi:hypothetical protein